MRELTFTQAAREALDEEMARDETIFVVGEGIGKRGGNFKTTVGLYEKYGEERLRDVPIAERGFIGMCTGAAMTGTRPVVDVMYFDFALDGAGEMINQTAKMQYMSGARLKMPIVIRGAIGLGAAAACRLGDRIGHGVGSVAWHRGRFCTPQPAHAARRHAAGSAAALAIMSE